MQGIQGTDGQTVLIGHGDIDDDIRLEEDGVDGLGVKTVITEFLLLGMTEFPAL